LPTCICFNNRKLLLHALIHHRYILFSRLFLLLLIY
jgi:hypothetical protein